MIAGPERACDPGAGAIGWAVGLARHEKREETNAPDTAWCQAFLCVCLVYVHAVRMPCVYVLWMCMCVPLCVWKMSGERGEKTAKFLKKILFLLGNNSLLLVLIAV